MKNIAFCFVALAASCCFASSLALVYSGSEGPTEVKDDGWMESSFSVDENGKLTAKTRTWSTSKFFGFTGGVFIALLNETKTPIWSSEQHKYGVNGKWIPGPDDRTEDWSEMAPLSVLPNVHSYAIVHLHTPTDRVWKWLKENSGTIISIAKVIITAGR